MFNGPRGFWACAQGESDPQLGPSGGTMRMLKRYPLVQAGNTKPAMTTFSDAIVLRDGDTTRKEAIGLFVGDINDYAHASIWHHLK